MFSCNPREDTGVHPDFARSHRTGEDEWERQCTRYDPDTPGPDLQRLAACLGHTAHVIQTFEVIRVVRAERSVVGASSALADLDLVPYTEAQSMAGSRRQSPPYRLATIRREPVRPNVPSQSWNFRTVLKLIRYPRSCFLRCLHPSIHSLTLQSYSSITRAAIKGEVFAFSFAGRRLIPETVPCKYAYSV